MGTFPCASLSQQSSKFAEVEIMGSVLSSRIRKFFLSLGGLRRCKCSMTGSPARQEALLVHFEGAIDVCCSFILKFMEFISELENLTAWY